MIPNGAETLHVFNGSEVDFVFDLARSGQKRMDIYGLNVSIRRMQCFAVKGTACVRCGLEGNAIMIDRWPNKQIHVDFFHVNAEGSRILMNIDHILPKSKGGANELDNYQPMCQPCNTKKGDTLES